ncbi:SufD family Fe-S cluster assembly protein [Oceanivirga miroungae]|uniref:SufBD protein n=1 Tax=Oceanivirga miroungae TaxID=1130046 RepID=A0A6I8M8P0_9FUSO|nr:SufD family Fe-S cluster assembly protein [Oceanivirga miroungae]VWL85185.1 SufBD protein [Oceanivirga miroungae]
MKYIDLEKPYFKRLEYKVTDTISYKDFNTSNISLQNTNENISFVDIDLNRPEKYRGLGEYFEIENKELLNHSIGINIKKENEKMIILKYDFDKLNDTLINGININLEENAKAKILVYYYSKTDESAFYHNGYIKVNAGKNSNLELITLQNLNSLSKNFTETDFLLDDNANVEYYDLELGSSVNLVASKTRLLGDNATMLYIPAYLVDKDKKADFEYSLLFHGKKGKGDIEARGTTKDFGTKVFRGNIYFNKGCKGSTASEGEFSILLDDTIKIHAIPAMLCDEDDVVGAHAASVGKVDEERLFYLMSRGFSKVDAKRIIVESTFRPIFEKIEDEKIKEDMFLEIKNRMN